MGARERIENENHGEGIKLFYPAAEPSGAEAQFRLGLNYAKGRGEGMIGDDTEAARWFRLAAEQGHAGGQNYLGFCCHEGRGVARDHAEAVRWYRLAAAQGNTAAQINLGCS